MIRHIRKKLRMSKLYVLSTANTCARTIFLIDEEFNDSRDNNK